MTRSQKLWKDVAIFGITALAACLALLWLAGCNTPPPSNQQVQQKAAQTTEQVKADAQKAADETRAAAAQAEQKLNAVADGVKQGLNNGSSPGTAGADLIDVNSASTTTLETLPGITPERAHAIERSRPYGAADELVSKGVLSKSEFDRISSQVAADH
jgi:DNA uptake protein ComE-like DNA-binding protein